MFTNTIGLLSLLLIASSTPIQIERAYAKSFIELKGMEFGLSEKRIDFIQRVVQCESNHRPNVYGDKGKAFSYFQFWEGTFNAFKKEWGHTWLNYNNPQDHLKLGVWAFSTGRLDSHWTCARLLSKL